MCRDGLRADPHSASKHSASQLVFFVIIVCVKWHSLAFNQSYLMEQPFNKAGGVGKIWLITQK